MRASIILLLHAALAMEQECETEVTVHLPDNRPLSLAQLSRIPTKDGAYPSTLSVFLVAKGARRGFHTSLHLNQELVSPTFRHDYYQDGVRKSHAPKTPGLYCYYVGSVDGEASSNVALNLCRGQINGMITMGEETYEVDSDPTGGALISLNNGDPNTSFTCDNLPRVNSLRSVSGLRKHRQKREEPAYYGEYLDGRIRYVELTIVNDRAMYDKFNSDLDLLGERTKQVANVVNSIYYPLNIRVVLVGMETWSEEDRISITEDGDATLNAFLHYRKTRLMTTLPSDNSQLLTNRNFETGVVGKALKGTMCSYEMSGGVNVDHHRRVVAVASTIAHEMGHNFGMEHDNDTCQCPTRKCIMSASSGGGWPPAWSSCSLEYLAHGLSHGADYCLLNRPSTWVGGPVCGNGLVEAGEQCDCGPVDSCDTTCCNATTCQLTEGAQCGSGECCNLHSCAFKARTTTCRAANTECDLSEHCDGHTELCPDDVHKQDGVSCSNGFCGRGKCGNRDQQCSLLWGVSGSSSKAVCYDYNTQGNFQGNCGHERLTKNFTRCLQKDTMCGRLQCRHENERTEFGFGVVAQTSRAVLRLGADDFAVCNVAMVDLGGPDDPDPGLVPDGAACGDDFDKVPQHLRLGVDDFAVCNVAMVDLGGPDDPDPGLVPDGAACGDDFDKVPQHLRLGVDDFAVCNVAMVDLGGPDDPDPGLVPDGAACGDDFDKVPQHLRLGVDDFAVCNVAMVDLGGPDDPDPGLVPDGAACGDDFDKMCYKQKCVEPVAVRSVRPCDPPDCNGRGVCNSNGHCHCHFGYAGRSCAGSGEGGSIDSGPTGPGAPAFTLGMGMALFGVVIFLILAVLILYWKKRRFMANNKLLRYLLPKAEQDRFTKHPPPSAPRRAPSIKHRPAPPPPQPVTVYSPPPLGDGPVKLSFDKPPPPLNLLPLAAVNTPVHSSVTLPRQHISGPIRGAQDSRLPYIAPTATLPRNKPPANYALYGTREDAPEPMIRQPSQRPTKRPPPRPERPQPEALEELHKERQNTPSPQEGDTLLNQVMYELRKTSQSPDPTPSDPEPGLRSPSPPPKEPSPPPEDPPPSNMTSSLQSRRQFFEAQTDMATSAPAPPPATFAKPEPSPRIKSPHPEPSPRVKGPLPPPPPPPPAKVAVTRSGSSASSTEGKARPKAAPPPPPASTKPKLQPPIAMEEEEENYYDVILTPTDEARKPPLPSKPAQLQASKVSSLAARFDAKSGTVQSAVLPK